MEIDLTMIVAQSEQRAAQIIASTAAIRQEFAAGRPNSSSESTVKGTLQAFAEIMQRLPDPVS